MREQAIERQLKKTIQAAGGLCWKLTCPGIAGVPDRICLMNGRVVFVEVKAPGALPRPLQLRRMHQLQPQGFTCLVLDNPDGIQEVLDALQAA